MKTWNRRRLVQTLVVLAAVVGVAAPTARASTPDAVTRYLTGQAAAPDAVARWLVARDAAVPFAPNPVSDVASSLGVGREQFERIISDAPRPISDTVDSLAVARHEAATSGAVGKGDGFAWRDAGIGAGATLLLVGIAACSLLVVRHHHHLAA